MCIYLIDKNWSINFIEKGGGGVFFFFKWNILSLIYSFNNVFIAFKRYIVSEWNILMFKKN